MFNKIISKIKFSKSSNVYKRRTLYPDRDWIFMVIFSLSFFVISGFFGFWIFNIISSGFFWKTDYQVDVKEYKLNKKRLDEFFKYIDEKQQRLDYPNVGTTTNPFN